MSTVGASTTLWGRTFHFLMVLGRKEAPLYRVLVVIMLNCRSWPRRCLGGGKTSLLFRVGHSDLVDHGKSGGLSAVLQRRPFQFVNHLEDAGSVVVPI